MNTINASDDDNLRRIADALERIANNMASTTVINNSPAMTFTGSNDALAKSVNAVIRESFRNGGSIPPLTAA